MDFVYGFVVAVGVIMVVAGCWLQARWIGNEPSSEQVTIMLLLTLGGLVFGLGLCPTL
jgi:uncharacterized membrane protein YedE/YeeE